MPQASDGSKTIQTPRPLICKTEEALTDGARGSGQGKKTMGSQWWLSLVGLVLLETVLCSGISLEEQPRTGYACEGSILTIECAIGRRIKILRANYGRFKRDVCNMGGSTELWDMQCMSTRSLRVVTEL
ncbi:hypothetical protein LSAT2_005812 [Lamellibrachia satsuma]|nr:hypothetical protein LSAT2_005812 [Lamellibrachia satsuma]